MSRLWNEAQSVIQIGLAVILAAFVVSISPVRSVAAGSIVIGQGPIKGITVGGVNEYLGIPYAAPPVGNLRWKPPQPVTPWDGVRPARAYAPRCGRPG